MLKRCLALCLSLCLSLGLAVPIHAVSFVDVPSNHWASPYIQTAAEKGWIAGVGDGLFAPDQQLTGAEFVTMVTRALYPEELSSSAASPWYLPYQEAANGHGLLTGDGVDLNDALTRPLARQEMAFLLAQAVLDQGVQLSAEQISTAREAIPDLSQTPSAYWDAICTVYGLGIIGGVDDRGTFAGSQTMTRAQAAVVLTKLDQVLSSQGSSGSGDRVLVSQPLSSDPLSYEITADSVYIQDLVEFCDGALDYGELSTSGTYHVRSFSGSRADLEILSDYVSTLCGGDYNLRLEEEYNWSHEDSTFFSWGINYIGTGDVEDTTQVTYTDVESTINVYGTIERDRLKASVWIPRDMEQVDLGLRYGGGSESVRMAGPSASAGLYRLSDGSYETTDGRLSVPPGEALILRDGTAYSALASFRQDGGTGRDELWIQDYYRDEVLFFCSPMDRLMTGDVYTLKDLTQEASWLNNRPQEVLTQADDFGDYTWTLFFGAGHDGSFITPLLSQSNEFEELTVRVMYWDKGMEAVYYIYAQFDTAPYTIEALCAVSLETEEESRADEEFSLSVGQSLDITCPARDYTNYQQFTWEIVEGTGLAELTGVVARTCTLTALRPGTVLLRSTYEYGIDEPDVLTGFPRNVNRSETRTYLITIS